MSRCRSCQAEIRWVKTASGSPMPIDATPVDNGNIVLDNGVAFTLAPYSDKAVKRYVSHFATCPHAREHRRR